MTRGVRVAAVLLALLVIGTVVRTSWMCDDAFIVQRVVDNILSGHGPRWNVVERVQAYTCPLWTALLVPMVALTQAASTSAWLLSWALTAGVLALVLRMGWSRPGAALGGVALLLGSQAFLDYSTSGLENPLGHLITCTLLAEAARRPAVGEGVLRGVTVPTTLLAVALLHRLDILPLVGPVAGFIVADRARGRSFGVVARAVLLGLLPLLLWLSWAALYYGSPIPNTAWAKLGHHAPRDVVWRNGRAWLEDALRHDPQSLLAPLAAAALLLPGPGSARAVALGVLLQDAWSIQAGGDFMRGRFLSTPLAAAACGLVLWAPARATLGLGALALASTLLAGRGLFAPTAPGPVESSFITDERVQWAQGTGLFSPLREPGRYQVPAWRRRTPEEGVVRELVIGARGWDGGPALHIIDELALTDAFLARVPVGDPQMLGARPGHFLRPIPDGYLESVADGTNRLLDPQARARFDDVLLLTRAPLFSPGRLDAMVRWHF